MQLNEAPKVRFGSKADIAKRLTDVRSTAKSGHRVRVPACPLSANFRSRGLLGLAYYVRVASGACASAISGNSRLG
jgi:hypothetical protein